MKTKYIFAMFLILSLLSACTQATPTITNPTVANPTQAPVSTNPPTAYPPPGSKATPVNTQAYPGPGTPTTQADSTQAQQAAIQDVATKYNIPSNQIKVLSADPMTWPNGCLGVVIPGVLCADIVTPGYLIKLEANGQSYEIHTNQDGSSVVDAAQQLATLEFVLQAPDNTLQVFNPNIPLGPTYNPAFNGFLPVGGAVAGTAYVLNTSQNKAIAITATSQQDLTFIQNPTTGLALWRGGPGVSPMLAWGTQPAGNDRATSLMIANTDGSNLQTLLTVSPNTDTPIQLVAEFWSADGEALYFSKEPVGLGGYILFAGASNLYMINIANKQVTEIIPQAPSNGPQICLDAVSGDYRFVVDHCTPNVITVRDLQSSSSSTIQMQSGFTGFGAIGTARFSPTGDRVAFALAKHDPNAEQGWIAIGNSSGGESKLILTGDPGSYYYILGWLDDQTLLIQSYGVGGPSPVNQVFTLSADGTTLTKVADGILLTVIDNR